MEAAHARVDTASGSAGETSAGPSTAGDGPVGVVESQIVSTDTPRVRSLRARPSIPASPVASSSSSSASRRLTDADLENIRYRLGPEGVAERRAEMIKEKEAAVKVVVDQHDTALREQFHLERFVTMITGWDPALAKVDNSPVYMDYKRFEHNLFDLVPQPANAVAGPSRARASRSSMPSRQTRRQAHEQIDIFDSSVPASSPVAVSGKGKGKVDATPTNHLESGQEGSMLPPPLPTGKGKKGRRQTLDPAALVTEQEANGGRSDALDGKGKKRGRSSLPVLEPIPKRGPGRPRKSDITAVEAEAEAVEAEPAKKKRGRPPRVSLPAEEKAATPDLQTPTGQPEREPASPAPTPAPIELPSLAHVPFNPPPIRHWPRPKGSRKLIITNPPQQDVPEPKFSGDIASYLSSYIHLEDNVPAPEIKALEARAEREGFLYNRVNYLMNQGRLSRLRDEDPEFSAPIGSGSNTKSANKPHVVIRQQDHQEALMLHMTQVRNAMLSEAKAKPGVCRKVARMITAYWDHIEGAEERERLKEEKEMKRKGKELVKGLRKRWALAVKVVRAKIAAEQKAEQDRLGKEHLQSMLKRSTGLLEAQQEFDLDSQADEEEADEDEDDAGSHHSDDDSGDGGSVDAPEDEDDEEDMDADGDSDGTDAVSAAVDTNSDTDDEDEDYDSAEGNHLLELLGDRVPETFSPGHEVEGSAPGPEVAAAQFLADGPSDEVQSTAAAAIVANGHKYDTPIANHTEEIPDIDEQDEAVVASDLVPAHPPSSPVSMPMRANGDAHTKVEVAHVDSSAEEPVSGSSLPLPAAVDQIDSHQAPPLLSVEEIPAADAPNGMINPGAAPPSAPTIRSRRARGVAKPLPAPDVEDPDANDNDFAAPNDLDNVDDEDHAMDVEMEEDEEDKGSKADSEDAGLLADADIPIEELLRRYGYEMPAANGHTEQAEIVDAPRAPTAEGTEDVDHIMNGNDGTLDHSLSDNAVGEGHSPTLVIDGKRQRRPRQVWTPEDNPPHPAKKPRIEIVKAELENGDAESDESVEESSEESSEEEDDDADAQDDDDGDVKMDEEEDPNAPKIRPPFLLRGTLRPYQHAGLDWLAGLYANNMNGILADEMGLGKTIQTISLLAHLACDRGVWGQHLIVVPTSVILNWEMEFKKFLPGFKVLTYYGNQKERKEKRVGWLTEHAWQVCITSYQIVLADQHIFRRKSWSYMILDEAHNIKNFRSQRWQTLLGFKAQRRLLLTGTPLQNNLMELWSLLYFLMPHGVAEEATAVVGFANHKDFMEWFSNPMDKAIESGDAMDEDTLATIAKLHTLLRPFILRRLKSEVETQLPGKFEHVVYCKLSKRQRFLYDEFMSRASTREALSSGGYLGVMNTLMQLRKVCNHPDLFEVRPVRTSFAMERSVASDFTPADLLVRKRLLARDDSPSALDIDLLGREGMGGFTARSIRRYDASDLLPHAIQHIKKGRQPSPPKRDVRTVDGWLKYRAWAEEEASVRRWRHLRDVNRQRCQVGPLYGSTLLDMLTGLPRRLLPLDVHRNRRELQQSCPLPVSPLIMSLADRTNSAQATVERFAIIPPNAVARDVSRLALPTLDTAQHPDLLDERFDTLHHAATKLQIAFPDASLLQYDCGKLQKLYEMLRDLKAHGHRVLIFTQMTRVLDILEIFLSFNGHRYLRLDGSTKIEDRQVITERFNSDARIFCFIASSRSGGVGINLTGADTVFFYDSDWNPSMDRQCMDRAHRIGQTREVHIYRFVSSHTVEENMLKKANQKRLLDRMVIQEGDFTTEFFGKVDWRDMIDDGSAEARQVEEREGIEDVAVEDEPEAEDVNEHAPRRGEEREFARMVAEVEDEEDVDAARIALGEGEMDMGDFDAAAAAGTKPVVQGKMARFESERAVSASATPVPRNSASAPPPDGGEEEEEEEDDVGAVDEYMLKWVEEDWAFFIGYRA